MSPSRNQNSYQTFVHDFMDDVWVVCPECEKKAVIKTARDRQFLVKLVCADCGFNKTSDTSVAAEANGLGSGKFMRSALVIGDGIDPYFRLPLWLKMPVGENIFWAYNCAHLNFLKDFVSAKLRERNLDNIRNKSLASRLPQWMTSAKNRELILKCIERLENK